METTHLSSNGEITLSESLRAAHKWETGQELIAIDFGDGILLIPKKTFPESTLTQVAGCLQYQGNAKSIEEMENAISIGLKGWHDCC